MKNFWKWIVGIVVVLLVLFVLGVASHLLMARFSPEIPAAFDGSRMPMMGGRPFGHMSPRMQPFGHFGMMGGWLPLLLVGLLAYGAYRLGKRGISVSQSTPSTPLKTCSNCAAPLQPAWNNCPNCGTRTE